jgi:hypothetical protein
MPSPIVAVQAYMHICCMTANPQTNVDGRAPQQLVPPEVAVFIGSWRHYDLTGHRMVDFRSI